MSDVATLGRLRAARAVALAIAVVAFLALAALALSADEGEAELREGAAGPRRTAVTPDPAVVVDQLPVRPRPAVTRPRVAAPTVTGPVAAPEPAVPPSVEQPDAPVPMCSLGLPAPARTGGLASMIALVPAFGSFSPEAFAMAPAYEPVIDLFGPFLPAFADLLAQNDALVAPAVAALRQLSDAGYTTLEPLYGPYRTDVLDGLRALGAALAPYSQQLAASDAAACLTALEGILAAAGA